MRDKIMNAGRFFEKKEVQALAKNHVAHVKAKKLGTEIFYDTDGQIRRAELFGKNLLIKLLQNTAGKEVAGIRIYYGHAPEDKDGNITKIGKFRPRLFLVPVDENGNDITSDTSALKSEPNGNALGGGLPCPQACNEQK